MGPRDGVEGEVWGKGGVGSRPFGFAEEISGLKFVNPIELEEILWRLICRCTYMYACFRRT